MLTLVHKPIIKLFNNKCPNVEPCNTRDSMRKGAKNPLKCKPRELYNNNLEPDVI